MADYQKIYVTPDTLRSIDSATFTGAYQAVGTALTFPIRVVKFLNNSNKDITISWDGSADNDFCPASGFTLYDFSANEVKPDGYMIPIGTKFYVKGAAGVGLVYIACFG